jgi:transposase
MQVQKAYKFQLKVRSRQQNKLRRAAGCCRFVWNWVASLNISQRDTLPEPAKRPKRKRKPTKARSRACGSRNPSVMAVANPTAGAGSNRAASLGIAEAFSPVRMSRDAAGISGEQER